MPWIHWWRTSSWRRGRTSPWAVRGWRRIRWCWCSSGGQTGCDCSSIRVGARLSCGEQNRTECPCRWKIIRCSCIPPPPPTAVCTSVSWTTGMRRKPWSSSSCEVSGGMFLIVFALALFVDIYIYIYIYIYTFRGNKPSQVLDIERWRRWRSLTILLTRFEFISHYGMYVYMKVQYGLICFSIFFLFFNFPGLQYFFNNSSHIFPTICIARSNFSFSSIESELEIVNAFICVLIVINLLKEKIVGKISASEI